MRKATMASSFRLLIPLLVIQVFFLGFSLVNADFGSSSFADSTLGNESELDKPHDLFSAKIQSLCPTITGSVCCTERQFDTLRSQVQQAIPLLVGCPACLRNFLNIFCELSCSPNQSLFINVTSTAKVSGNLTVDGIEFFVSEDFGEGLYDSCKDVKFGSMNTRAIDFVGAGAKNYEEWFAFIGQKAGLGMPGSPYSINFHISAPESSGMQLMDVSTYSCNDTSLGCSCGDCPSSSGCSSPEPPHSRTKDSCSIRLGSFEMKCIDLSMTILYILLLSAFLGWGFFYRTTERGAAASSTQPLLNEADSIDEASVDTFDVKDIKTAPQSQSTIQGFMTDNFRKYGLWVARNPTIVLCFSVAIVLILCLGLLRFKVETRPEKLWVGPGSKAAEEKHFFDTHLAPFYRIEQIILATRPDPHNGKSPSIVTEDNIQLLFDIQQKVDELRVNYSGSMVSLSDICLKPLGEDCAIQSILQYFQMDPYNYDEYGGIQHALYCFQHFTSTDTCLSAFKAPLDPSTALGGFSGNNFSEASAFVVTYPVTNMVDESSDANAKAVEWERAFIKLAKEELLPMVQHSNLTLSFSSESSIEDELKRESNADVITILISYLVMFAYISLTLGDKPRLSTFYISSKIRCCAGLMDLAYSLAWLGLAHFNVKMDISFLKVLLGLSGVVVVILSVLGSVGFFSAFGVKSTLIIMEVIPFLVLAVGVDNMCILVHAAKRQPIEIPLEQRISNALVEVGPSITLASLSEVLAFAVGAFITMPACRVFSMFAALAVLLDFLLQLSAFVALIVLDFKRAEEYRIDCFPCIRISSESVELDRVGVFAQQGSSENSRIAYSVYEEAIVHTMTEIHAPILSLRGVKVVVLALFAGLSLAGIALCPRIEPGLEQQIALPRDSYLQGYFNDISEYLRVGPPLYFVVKDYNYSSKSRHTNQLCSISKCDSNSLLNEISRASLAPESSYIAKPAASWLDDFLVWLSPDAFGCCRKFVNGSYCPPDDQVEIGEVRNGAAGKKLGWERAKLKRFGVGLWVWVEFMLGVGQFRPPCCLPEEGPCGFGGVCKDCTTCFRHSDLDDDRPSTAQFREKLPWFLDALPSADCAKGGHGAYTTSLDLTGYEGGIIRASEFRTYHTPVNRQSDYVNALRAARQFSSKISDSLKMEIFPYSVFYIFFEQYLDIWTTALINLAIALGAVFIVCLVITSSLWSSAIILLVLAMIVVDLMGVMAILGIQLNAVSVVNLIMSIGIAVEFCVHITHAFSVSHGNRNQRAKEALGTMGASVFSGITLTKLVGVIVLCFARSEIFVVYYFQMYLALVIIGFLHGLIFLPVLLSLIGPPPRSMPMERTLEPELNSSS
ncbi:NPC intracellular cholesterol transporter 1-like protein 1b [Bienertia sinuspersici]